MAIDRPLRNEPACANLLVAHALGHQLCDLRRSVALWRSDGCLCIRGDKAPGFTERECNRAAATQVSPRGELVLELRCAKRRIGRLPGLRNQGSEHAQDARASLSAHPFRGPEELRVFNHYVKAPGDLWRKQVTVSSPPRQQSASPSQA